MTTAEAKPIDTSSTRITDDGSCIVANRARFAALAEGVVRMEYSPSGRFENRASLRVSERPAPLPFESVEQDDITTCLTGGGISIRFIDDGNPFSSENLIVTRTEDGAQLWKPGQVDEQNLGGVHQGMDVVQRSIIPSGVHPATTAYHENGSETLLWNYAFDPDGESVPGVAQAYGRLTSLEQVLKTREFAELPPRIQTIIRERQKYPPGLLSRAGYFLFNDSGSAVLDDDEAWLTERDCPQDQDFYLFHYGNDFRQAMRDYRAIFGASPLPPRYTLGLWYSRYPTFDEPGLRELIEIFEQQDLPLDVLVLDLEWHQRGWNGFDWDTTHIHNPDDFLAHLREEGIHTTFNVHPNGVPVDDSRFEAFIKESGLEMPPVDPGKKNSVFSNFDISNKRQASAFMDVLHKPVQQQGIDFWWIDGHAPVETAGVDKQFWTNHVYRARTEAGLPDRRPMIFSRTGGFGSHRYPIHFTGDTYSQWEVLRSQVEYTVRAGHIGQSFLSHDIGGHMNDFEMLDPELYCRWVQFGALSPIFRLHSSRGGERRPWLYEDKVQQSFKQAIRLRTELLPTLYSLARESHDSGMPMCRSAALAQPDWEQAYDSWDAYFLGEDIFCTPQLSPGGVRDVLLPAGSWYDSLQHRFIESDGQTAITATTNVIQAPLHYIRAGSLIVKQPYALRASQIPDTLILECYLGDSPTEHEYMLYDDDGHSRAHREGSCTRTQFVLCSNEQAELTIGASQGAQPVFAARNYHVRVYGGVVSELLCNGQHISPVSAEDSEAPFTTFHLNDLSCVEAHDITVQFIS
jgi:hypothetical protein